MRVVPVVDSPEREPPDTVKSSRVRVLTVSFKVIVMVQEDPAVSAVEHPLNVTVGAAVSRVIVVVAVAAVEGPVFPAASAAPLNAKRGMTVPSPQFVMVTVRVEPVSDPGEKLQFCAVPEFEKSPEMTPVTDSENCSVYVNDEADVGDCCEEENEVTVGATESFVKVMV